MGCTNTSSRNFTLKFSAYVQSHSSHRRHSRSVPMVSMSRFKGLNKTRRNRSTSPKHPGRTGPKLLSTLREPQERLLRRKRLRSLFSKAASSKIHTYPDAARRQANSISNLNLDEGPSTPSCTEVRLTIRVRCLIYKAVRCLGWEYSPLEI